MSSFDTSACLPLYTYTHIIQWICTFKKQKQIRPNNKRSIDNINSNNCYSNKTVTKTETVTITEQKQ